jgi:uncharacterized protein (DUF2236 family)
MEAAVPAPQKSLVTRDDLESLIAVMRLQVRRPSEGIFGPESLSWKINRESALFLGAGRAALLQLAHPWVATALDQHSSLLEKPIARFHNTFRVVFTMIFGSLDQAIRASRSLHELHTRIRGELDAAVAGYAAGSGYQANHIPALRWVFATLIESAVIAYECTSSPLSETELNTYYAEAKTLAQLFGIHADTLPPDWRAFKVYIAEMCQSQALGVSDRSLIMAHRILTGAGSWISVPRWYRALTAEWLPPRFIVEFGLQHGIAEEALARRAQRWLPHVYRSLPSALRFVGPYHEAQARLGLHKSSSLAQLSNRFWIGETRLPFGRNENPR